MTNEKTMIECAYCMRNITEMPVPAVGNDDAWADLAKAHAHDCAWIATRARRPAKLDKQLNHYATTYKPGDRIAYQVPLG